MPAASLTCIRIVLLLLFVSVVDQLTLVPLTELLMFVQVVPLSVEAHSCSAEAAPLADASPADSVAVIVCVPVFATPSLPLEPVSEPSAIALTVVGCPLRSSFEEQVSTHVGALPGVTSVELRFDVMTPDERAALHPALTDPDALEKVGHGILCEVGEEGGAKIYGRSLTVAERLGGERVRLIGVDTPELHHPVKPVQHFAREARDYVQSRVAGRDVRLEYDQTRRDRYGRTLAYVFLADGSLLNLELIERGYGFAYTKFPFRADYMARFRRAEAEARLLLMQGRYSVKGEARNRRITRDIDVRAGELRSIDLTGR